MCISTVYKGNEASADNILAEYIANIKIEDGLVRFLDITGEETIVAGALRSVDLVSGRVFIDPA